MKRSILAAAGLTAAALVVGASPAFADDCIRVSSMIVAGTGLGGPPA